VAVKPTEAELRQEILELKTHSENLGTTKEDFENQVRLLRDQLEEKQSVFGQVVSELAQSEEASNRERSDALIFRGKLEEAENRINAMFADLERRGEELGRQEIQVASLRSEKLELERANQELEVLVLEGAREQPSYWEAELQSMVESFSWRLALPIRLLGRLARRTSPAELFRRLSKIRRPRK